MVANRVRFGRGKTFAFGCDHVQELRAFQFTDVLLVGADDDVKIGRPLVEGASVSAKIVTQGRGPKIKVFKRKRRQGFHKMIGHRQPFTEVEITSISA